MLSTPATGIILLYSAGTFSDADYSVGAARCDTPLGPCRRIYSTPLLASRGAMFGPGGQTPFQLADGSWQLAFHGWEGVVGYESGGVRSPPHAADPPRRHARRRLNGLGPRPPVARLCQHAAVSEPLVDIGASTRRAGHRRALRLGVPRPGQRGERDVRRTSPRGRGGHCSRTSCATCRPSISRPPCSGPASPHRSWSRRPRCTASSPTTASSRRTGGGRGRHRVRGVDGGDALGGGRRGGRARRAALGADVHAPRSWPYPRAGGTCRGGRVPRDRGVGRRSRGRAWHRQRVGRPPHAAGLDALPEPGDGRRRRQLRHHADGRRTSIRRSRSTTSRCSASGAVSRSW